MIAPRKNLNVASIRTIAQVEYKATIVFSLIMIVHEQYDQSNQDS